ncbi:MAG: glycerol-3-phosphate 1-O-acyltransferase PlsY [Tepidisphaeraceae bacterium]
MTNDHILLILIPLAYVVGSIPVGLIVGRAKGIDPRASGSGNIGATNLGRLLGAKYFALVFTLDLLKGALPTLAAGAVIGFGIDDRQTCLLWIAVAAAAVLGHVFSLFLKFKGGKGVATTAGIVLGIYPYFTFAGLIAIFIFIIVFRFTRYISVGSILAALSFPAAYISIGLGRWPLTGAQLPLLCFAIFIPLLIIYKHRGNIARLRAGTELRAGPKSSCASK